MKLRFGNFSICSFSQEKKKQEKVIFNCTSIKELTDSSFSRQILYFRSIELGLKKGAGRVTDFSAGEVRKIKKKNKLLVKKRKYKSKTVQKHCN